jgi:hypothetical protein
MKKAIIILAIVLLPTVLSLVMVGQVHADSNNDTEKIKITFYWNAVVIEQGDITECFRGTQIIRMRYNEESLTLTFWLYDKGGTFKYVFPKRQKDYFKKIALKTSMYLFGGFNKAGKPYDPSKPYAQEKYQKW